MDAVTIIIVLAIVAPFILIGIRHRRARERPRKTARLPAKSELWEQPVAGEDMIASPPLSLWAWYSSRTWPDYCHNSALPFPDYRLRATFS